MNLTSGTGPAVSTQIRDRVLVVTLDRPEVRNAIDADVARGLLAAAAQLDGDPNLAVGVLTGAGRGFCAGMDLKDFVAHGTPPGLLEFVSEGARKPLVCAVEGFALAGGLELALTCDLIVAARGASFGIPEVSVGLFAAGGGLLRLPRRVPYGVAMKMALTADPISAEEAYEHGLVCQLVEPGNALDAALTLAERVAANAPLAVAASKLLVRESLGRTEDEFWAVQRPHVDAVFATADAREGATAFAEKRPPRWESA